MTAKETTANLLSLVTAGAAGAYEAAVELTALKRKSKKSFAAMGLTEQEAALVADTVTAGPNVARLLEDAAAAADDVKMPAGVHKLTNMPKGNNVKGKVWADVTVVLPDGSATVPGRVEMKRGAFVYFYVGEQGYRAQRERFNFTDGQTFALNDKVK